MFKRPKPGENEEDILRLQEEFLREKNKNELLKPAAKVINLRKTEHQTIKRSKIDNLQTRKPSKYAQSKGRSQLVKRSKNDESVSFVLGDMQETNTNNATDESEDNDDKVYFPKVIPAVLGDIVEKNMDKFVQYTVEPMPSKGFPIATKRDANVMVSGPQSIFGLQMDKGIEEDNQKEKLQMDVDFTSDEWNLPETLKQETLSNELNIPSTSYTSTNKDDIHSENIKILSKMSEKEILEEQHYLLSSLNPKLVKFIKEKQKQNSSNKLDFVHPNNEKENKMEIIGTSSDAHNDDDTLWHNDILDHPEINNWLNFDSLEKDKLLWMKSIEESKHIKPDEPYEARFDFKGYLLPYTMKYTEETKTLFHHGVEPHRPGYSLTELIELSRSSVTQQRVMALNAIAGILEYYSMGTYKNVIEIPLSKIFFVVRLAMDENKVIILEPALKSMRNLLFNRIDEACLDALIGFEEGTFQPCLENDKSEIEELDSKESEIKDFHLAEIDIITAILRTDILQRLFYIIDTVRPSFNSVQYALQILTRLARDSVELACTIVQTDHLMNAIIENFIPATSINFTFNPEIVYNGKPVLAALKLMRILSLQSRAVAETLISKYDIFKPISEYITSGIDGTYGLRLQMESYCILSNLVHYDLGINLVTALFPVTVTTLYKHVQGTDIFYNNNNVVISSSHAAVVLQLLNKMFNCNLFDLEKYGHQIYPLVKEGFTKWTAQIAHLESYTCGHLRVACAILDCCNTILLKTKISLEFLNNGLKLLSTSKGIKTIVKNLIPCSNLLSGIEERNLNYTKNLTTLGGAVVDCAQKVLPILNVSSPMPFLVSLFKVLVNSNNKDIADCYLQLVQPYLKQVIRSTPSLISNWFSRMEIEFIFNIVKLSLKSNVVENFKDIVYAVAHKLCFILRIDKQNELSFLFDNVIFNKHWFTAERLFNLVSLSEIDGLSKILTSVEDIKLCYRGVINLNYTEKTPNITLRKWQQTILPRDWIYLPIVTLYSNSQEMAMTCTVTGAQKELIMQCSLEWILFNELCFPEFLNDIHVTDRFCRVMCVFLCDNSLFLDQKIKILLYRCIKILFKKASEFDFEKQLLGLNSFEDLYIQLLEQFQAVSYGDHNFAACILVPLAQHHNVKWRKTLWSEYAGCLRVLDCPENYLCYDLNKYLYPEETDKSLIKCYFRTLSGNLLRPGTIVHKIASHHTESFKVRCSVTRSVKQQ